MPEPLSSGAASAYAAAQSAGAAKLWATLSGIAGSALMIAIRPNLTRKQLILHAVVAGAMARFTTALVVRFLDGSFGAIDLKSWPTEDVRDFYVMVGFVIGALSWGIVGAVYYVREKLGTNPIEAIQEWRNLRSGGASIMGTPRGNLAPSTPVAQSASGTGNEAKFDQ